MSLFAELKRRNVFRVGIAYLVVAWLVVQVADVMIDNLGAPDWVFGTILLVLGVGFPVVLVFAWAFELTPDGLKRDSEVDRSQSIANQTGRKLDRTIIVILALAVIYLLVDKLVLDRASAPGSGTDVELTQASGSPETGRNADREAGKAEPGKESVAVLPFVNMSADPDNEYFSDGLTETLLHMLAQLPELRVAARTSSFAFKGQNRGVDEIAATLGVAHVLEGSVQKAGDRVRVTAQLIRAEDGFHLWSQNYTRPLEDVFAIQDEIAQDVADALGASLLGADESRMEGIDTTSLAAYDPYLKGLEQQALGSHAGLDEAELLFQRALVEDPAFTDARLALVRNFMRKRLAGMINSEALLEAALPLIQQVYESHPDNKQARAYELMITARWGDAAETMDDVRDTIEEIRNLLAVIPTESFMRTEIALAVANILDDPQGGIELLQAGMLVDPMDPALHSALGRIYDNEGRFEEAESELRRAIELEPRVPGPYVRLSQLEQSRNNLPAAMQWGRRAIEADPQDHELAAQMAEWLYQLELPEEAAPWAERVRTLAPGSAIARNMTLMEAQARGNDEQVIEIARGMIDDQVDTRLGAFSDALYAFAGQMMRTGRSKEAYDFLLEIRPNITEFDLFPNEPQEWQMQLAAIALMSGFASPDDRLAAWDRLVAAMRGRGFTDWPSPESAYGTWDAIIRNDIETAVVRALDHLSEPFAESPWRGEPDLTALLEPVLSDPRVVTALAEREREFARVRREVQDMLAGPEWN